MDDYSDDESNIQISMVNKHRKPSQKKAKDQAPNLLADAQLARQTGYAENKATMQLWKGTVERNRLADRLAFPLPQRNIMFVNSAEDCQIKAQTQVAETMKKTDSVGGKLYSLLYPPTVEKESVRDEWAEDNPTLLAQVSQLREMKAEQAKRRARQADLASKQKRQGKIKSKAFHRHLKRRRVKQFEVESEVLRQTDPEAYAERIATAERMRAEERASLRHKTGSKFAKFQRLRAKHNTEGREAVQEMLERARELTKKTGATLHDPVDDDSEDESSSTESDCEDREEGEGDGGADDAVAHWGATAEQSGSVLDKSTKRNKNAAGSGKTRDTRTPIVTELAANTLLDSSALGPTRTLDGDDLIDPADDADSLSRRLAVACGEDRLLTAEFAAEKAAIAREEAPKDVDTFLPGWNCWTGPGWEKKDAKRRVKFIMRAPKVERKDKRKRRVIIRERANTELRKHLVKNIPFPYNTADQFESVLGQPLCREWNTENNYRLLTKPRVVCKPGQIIRPISKEAAIIRRKHREKLGN